MNRMVLKVWFDRGKKEKCTHMLVVSDMMTQEDYPAYVLEEENVHEKIMFVRRSPLQRIMEVYDLNPDRDAQLDAERVYNIPHWPSDDSTGRKDSN